MVQPGDFKPLKALIQFWVVQENHREQFDGLMQTPVNEVHQGASLNGEGPNLQSWLVLISSTSYPHLELILICKAK